MKKHILLLPSLLLVVACNPFEERQAKTRQAISNADIKARQVNKRYEPKIREIKPYQVYSYQAVVSDPFRVRDFIVQEETTAETDVVAAAPEIRCVPPECVPPTPHPKSLLENYGLDALGFVGTLGAGSGTALIKTPDFGIVPAQVGDYMGRNNGVILEIRDSAIILQEKLRKNGLWENKKTVLMIK